jgi:hypothetical protein
MSFRRTALGPLNIISKPRPSSRGDRPEYRERLCTDLNGKMKRKASVPGA